MTLFIATYEVDIDHGDVPAEAMAEFLTKAGNMSDWNIWELGTPIQTEVKVKDKK